MEPTVRVLELRRIFPAAGTWLSKEDLSQSWHELLRVRRGIAISFARTIVEATLADTELAAHLGIGSE
jgi:DNA-binding GntR family transcriptional regulator